MSITISIVNHRHCDLIVQLLNDLSRNCENIHTVIITNNVNSKNNFLGGKYRFKLRIKENEKPLGFAENHNNAFLDCTTKYFCVLNPDIRLHIDPFPKLVQNLTYENIGLVAPRVRAMDGSLEDSARYFPTPISILNKALFGDKGEYDEQVNKTVIYPDWIAGMFILCRADIFNRLNGFDKKYYLYYEDIDICLRTRKLGYEIALVEDVEVFHDAQRASHRNVKFLIIHLKSMSRFFMKHLFRYPKRSDQD